MSTITTRAGKGSPLTNTELDANFTNLNTDKLELGGTYSGGTANGVAYLNGSKVLTTGSALTFDGELLSAPRVSSKQGIFTNANTITANQTIAATDNAGSYGPMSINSGVVVTVSSGAVWTII